MGAANELVDIIRDIYSQEYSKKDQTILCRVTARVDDTHYDLTIVPDTTSVLRNIPNMTPYVFSLGDYCYIYKINNQLSNSFICDKLITVNNQANETQTLTLGEERLAPKLQDMELTTNKTYVVSGDSTDQQYPSALAVHTAISQASKDAQRVYVIDAEANPPFATDAQSVTLVEPVVDTSGNVVDISQLKIGDSFYVIQDMYPNRWVETIDSGSSFATLKSMRIDSGAGVVEDVTLNESSVVRNNIAALTTGNGIVANGSELSLSISGYNSINPQNQPYSILNNLDIYLQSGTTGYRAAVSNLPYSRMVVQAPNSEDLTAVNNGDYIFARNS